MENEKYTFQTDLDPKFLDRNDMYDPKLSPGQNYRRYQRIYQDGVKPLLAHYKDEFEEGAVDKLKELDELFGHHSKPLRDIPPCYLDDETIDGDVVENMFKSKLFMNSPQAKDLKPDSQPHKLYEAAKEFQLFKIENDKQRRVHFMLRSPAFLESVNLTLQDRNSAMMLNYFDQFDLWLRGSLFEHNKRVLNRLKVTKDNLVIGFHESEPQLTISVRFKVDSLPKKRFKFRLTYSKEISDMFSYLTYIEKREIIAGYEKFWGWKADESRTTIEDTIFEWVLEDVQKNLSNYKHYTPDFSTTKDLLKKFKDESFILHILLTPFQEYDDFTIGEQVKWIVTSRDEFKPVYDKSIDDPWVVAQLHRTRFALSNYLMDVIEKMQ